MPLCMANIIDHLPERKNKPVIVLVQARVEKGLAIKAKSIMKQHKYTWGDILTASLEQFISENKSHPLSKRKRS